MDRLLPRTKSANFFSGERPVFNWLPAPRFSGATLFFRTVEAGKNLLMSITQRRLTVFGLRAHIGRSDKNLSCRDDERHHLDDARRRAVGSSGLAVLFWVELVTPGIAVCSRDRAGYLKRLYLCG